MPLPGYVCKVRRTDYVDDIKEKDYASGYIQNETRARIRGHFSRTIFTPPNPLIGGTLGSLVANLVFCSKRSLPYQREVWRDCLYSRGLFRETHKKKDSFMLSFVRWAENESLSICSPLCISSNYLCPVLYSQFEGHLGCFKVSFSSPTFAIQTSELQLLTTNLRIIFELTKSKRDGLYLEPPLFGLLNISTHLRFAITLVGD